MKINGNCVFVRLIKWRKLNFVPNIVAHIFPWKFISKNKKLMYKIYLFTLLELGSLHPELINGSLINVVIFPNISFS